MPETSVEDETETMPSKTSMGRIWQNLRHPAAVTLLGFLLTTFIGSQYDQILNERARLAAMEQQSVEELEAFAELVYERQVRTDLVRSAVNRRNREEAIARKTAYDAIYVRWNTELYSHIKSLRSLIGREFELTPYDDAIQMAIIPSFVCSDALVTNAYDWSYRTGFEKKPPVGSITSDSCKGKDTSDWQGFLKRERDRVRNCTHAILDNMLPQIRSLSSLPKDKVIGKAARDQQNAAILDQLARTCLFAIESVR
ncbi:MAG: hypothetical protein AAF526_02460 [Pseudomonadota bacterium]